MARPRTDLPTGTVTFLFSDIEDSTGLVQRLGTDAYRELLERHNQLLRAAFAAHGGVERSTEGDSFLVVFRDARSAVAASVAAQRAVAGAEWPGRIDVRVRMGLHSGEGVPGGDDYVGVDVNLAARIAAAAHGGQVLLSAATRALAERTLPEGTSLRDLGEHRLRGIELPARLHQLSIDGLLADFPPPRGAGRRGAGLPPRSASFVGRRAELDALRGLLATSRLTTLLGPGGVGKTSLAVELAREVGTDYADGAWFAALEGVDDPDLVAAGIVASLDLRGAGDQPPRDRLLDNLADRTVLLVLDNFEHVADAAPLVRDLLRAAPGLRVLVTSRAPLHLADEQLFPVGPLGEPESVRLFVERARRTDPGFSLDDSNQAVAEICQRLDGLPLGIELAAARVGLFGLEGLRDRLAQHLDLPASPLRDAPERQRTLRGAIEWSHSLLDPQVRRVFGRLSVFAGGGRLGEIEAVCGDGDASRETFELLAALLDQSLLERAGSAQGPRFRMLETIREFAAGRLVDSGEFELIRRRHLEAYVRLAEEVAPGVESSRRPIAMAVLGAERDNFWAASRWAVDSGEAELGLRLCVALTWFWTFRGESGEAVKAIEDLLALPSAVEPSGLRMRALEAAGHLHYYRGEHDRTLEMYRAQLDIARGLGDEHGIADARFNLSFMEDWAGRAEEGMAELEAIAADYRRLGDERAAARADWGIANFVWDTGDLAAANDLMAGLVRRFHELDDPRYESMAAGSLGGAAIQAGDRETGVRWLVESVVRGSELGDVVAITPALPILALAAGQLVGPEAVATIMGAFEALSRRYGISPPRSLAMFMADAEMDPLSPARAAMDPALFAAAQERGRQMDISEVVRYVVASLQDAVRGTPAGTGGSTP